MRQISILLALIACSVVTIEAGVRIEINRVKEEPKSNTMPTVIAKMPVENVEEPEAPHPAMQTTEMPATILTTSTHLDETTIIPILLEESNKSVPIAPIPPNATIDRNIVPLSNTSITIPVNWNTINPLLSEYTRRQMRRKLIPPNYYCPCDLKINFCDINCCCDVDCASKEIMQTLKCNDRDWTIYDYEETSDLQLCSQTHGFSLFCIVDNSRKRKEYRRRNYKVRKSLSICEGPVTVVFFCYYLDS